MRLDRANSLLQRVQWPEIAIADVRHLGDLLPISRATAARALNELEERGVHRTDGAERVLLQDEDSIGVATDPGSIADRTNEVASGAFMRWRPENQTTVSSESHNDRTRT